MERPLSARRRRRRRGGRCATRITRGWSAIRSLIEPDKDDRWFTILAGEPTAGDQLVRITQFDDAAAAMDFCDRIAPLAEWHKAPEWLSTGCPPELDRQMHEIAVELTQRTNGRR